MVDDLRQVDLTDLDTFAGGFPHDVFRLHRELAPVWWHEPTAHTPDGEGFWSVATYDEVLRVLHDPVTYSSETGGDRPYGGTVIQDLPVAGVVLNMMDDPRHARIRRLVTRGLTPPRSAGSRTSCATGCAAARRRCGGACDFLVDVAAELPMQAICILLGVPETDRHLLLEAVEHIFDIPDESDFLSMSPQRQAALDHMLRLRRRAHRGEARLPGRRHALDGVHAELADDDPPRLSDDELSAFFSLLFAAGAETTRNADRRRAARVHRMARAARLAATGPSSHGAGDRGDPALDHAVAVKAPHGDGRLPNWRPSDSRRAKRWSSGRVRRTGMRRDSSDRMSSTSAATRTRTSPSGTASTSVSGHASPASKSGWRSRSCSRPSTSFALAGEPVWTRSNRHTGIRHMPLRLVRAGATPS